LALILDTTVALAALDAADRDHVASAKLIAEEPEELIVPTLVLAELDYWCHERLTPDVWLAFLKDVLDGAYTVVDPTRGDLVRCDELQRTYADLKVGVVDASILALVERLGEPRLATLDHRHFDVMRPRHVKALELLPAGVKGRSSN
jgi:predicted nucleic acid-binding protein